MSFGYSSLLINSICIPLYTWKMYIKFECFISREYLKEWNKTKQEANDLQRKYEDFLSRLASKLSVDLAGNDKPMETVVSLVS